MNPSRKITHLKNQKIIQYLIIQTPSKLQIQIIIIIILQILIKPMKKQQKILILNPQIKNYQFKQVKLL